MALRLGHDRLCEQRLELIPIRAASQGLPEVEFAFVEQARAQPAIGREAQMNCRLIWTKHSNERLFSENLGENVRAIGRDAIHTHLDKLLHF